MENNTPFFSVVIPVYNAEKTLANCVNSILVQSFKDYEILLINDGSNDSSKSLCEDLENSHPFIYSFSQKNKGVSSARNKGINMAQGKYVAFVDSDDTVKQGWLQSIFEKSEETHADIVSFGIENIQEDTLLSNNRMYDFVAYGNKELRPHFEEFFSKLIGSACTKAYSRAMLKEFNIKFDESIHVSEDSIFDYECLNKAKSIANIDAIFYQYYQHETSSTHKGRKDILSAGIKKSQKLAECLYKMNYDSLAEKIPKRTMEQDIYAHYLQAVLTTVPFSFKERKEILKEIFTVPSYRRALLVMLKSQPRSLTNIIGIIFTNMKCISILALLACIKRYLSKN